MTTINEIPIVIYPYNVFVVCTDATEEIVTVINRKIKEIRRAKHFDELLYSKDHFKNIGGYTAVTQAADGMAFIILTYDESRSDCKDRITLTHNAANCASHEALHVVSDIMKHVGLRWDADNDESIAYLVGHITKGCMIHLKNFFNKIEP